MSVLRPFVALALLVSATLVSAPTASAASWEIDVSGTVYRVIDGDTLDAFPVGRIRLADIDAPESGQPGYQPAKDFLTSAVQGLRVYFDVDDVNVMDSFNRLVAVVYVRHSDTHLMNVNKALLDSGLIVRSDYPNEFDPSTWTLYVESPVSAVPEQYDPLLQRYLEMSQEFDALSADFAALQRDYAALRSSYSQLLIRFGVLEQEYANLQAQFTLLEQDRDALATRVVALEAELAALRSQVDASRAQSGEGAASPWQAATLVAFFGGMGVMYAVMWRKAKRPGTKG